MIFYEDITRVTQRILFRGPQLDTADGCYQWTLNTRRRLFTVRAKLHYTDNGYEYHQRTPPTDKNLPYPNILTCRDVGLWHCEFAMWQICYRIVSLSICGVRSRCPCSGVWLLGRLKFSAAPHGRRCVYGHVAPSTFSSACNNSKLD